MERRPAPIRATAAAFLAWLMLSASPARAGGVAEPDHSAFDALLRKYVAADGVRYAAWHANPADRQALAAYLTRMQTADVSALGDTPEGRRSRLAFWLNLYNAATLDLVLDGFPAKSIKDLGGALKSPWDREVVVVEGRKLTLNAIENDVIRPAFREPRIHFALNCAAKSCPPLRAEAYTAAALEKQLEEQTSAFLANGRFTRLDGKRLTLSKIFDWYRKDFEAAAGSVVAWVRPYHPALAALPSAAKVDVTYAEYDWALNDAK